MIKFMYVLVGFMCLLFSNFLEVDLDEEDKELGKWKFGF